MQPKGTKTKQQNWGQSSSRNETKQQPGGDKAATGRRQSSNREETKQQPLQKPAGTVVLVRGSLGQLEGP